MLEQSRLMAQDAAKALQNKKARGILISDIHELTIISDYFVICDGNSTIQVKALADEVMEKMDEGGYRLLRKEGYGEGRWILLDYGDVIVHVFHKEEREFYNLERLWADARVQYINNEITS